MRRVVFALALSLIGCKATIPSGRFACDLASDCPPEFACVAGLCVREGAPDAGPVDGGRDASRDGAMPPDAQAEQGENTAPLCSDGDDNDGDGATDCEDASCCGQTDCASTTLCGRCVDGEVRAPIARIKPAILLMLDSSGSMNEPFAAGLQRWQGLVQALTGANGGAITELEPFVRAGAMTLTGMAGQAGCASFRELPTREAALADLRGFMQATNLVGSTFPTEGFPRVRRELQTLMPDPGPRRVLYFVDSDPGTCAVAGDVANGTALTRTAVQALFAEGVPTSVIGIGEMVTLPYLEQIARAGSGEAIGAQAPALDLMMLRNAIRAAIVDAIPCELPLPAAVPASARDRVVVRLGATVIARDDAEGWTLAADDRLRLTGRACGSYRTSIEPLTIAAPCEAFQRQRP